MYDAVVPRPEAPGCREWGYHETRILNLWRGCKYVASMPRVCHGVTGKAIQSVINAAGFLELLTGTWDIKQAGASWRRWGFELNPMARTK